MYFLVKMASVGPWYASLNCPLTNEDTRETSKRSFRIWIKIQRKKNNILQYLFSISTHNKLFHSHTKPIQHKFNFGS